MKLVAIVDYGMGNIDSVGRAVADCGCKPLVTKRPEDFASAHSIILPGVGAFGDGMASLRAEGLDQVLGEQVRQGIPTLGICLGMQLLASEGTEHGLHCGLDWIPGRVERFVPTGAGERIPHVGWNEVWQARPSPLFDGIEDGKDFYFVHSYHFVPASKEHVLGRTPYCGGCVSVVNRDNVYGAQFHPEKSQRVGHTLLRNFLSL